MKLLNTALNENITLVQLNKTKLYDADSDAIKHSIGQ